MTEKFSFNIDNHVLELMSCRGSEAPNDYNFQLRGDLDCMGIQKKALQYSGINVLQSDVYPVIREVDKISSLRRIWDSLIKGWWHYKEEMIEGGICSAEEWETAIGNEEDKKTKTEIAFKKEREREAKEKKEFDDLPIKRRLRL